MPQETKNILKQIWSKETALKENLLKSDVAESMFKSLIEYVDKTLPEDSMSGLRYRKLKTDKNFKTWWTASNGYPAGNPWDKIKPILDLLEQYEAEKTIKERLETEGLFVETRSRGEDQTILVGKRDGSGEKAHIVIDGKTAEIRVEDTRKEPTDVLAKIETILTLPNGNKKIRTTREVIEEISPAKMCVIEIETNRISVGSPIKLKEGVSGSFMVTIPFLIRNYSNDKIHVRDVSVDLNLPNGYKAPSRFNFDLRENTAVNARDVFSGVVQFSTSIVGDEGGASDGNPVWVENKKQILDNIANAKIILQFKVECVGVSIMEKINEIIDLTAIVLPQIWDQK
jgi:hypothetical protein